MNGEKEIKFDFPKKEKEDLQAYEDRIEKLYADIAKLSISDIKAIMDEAQVMMNDAMEGNRSSMPSDYDKWEEIYTVMEGELHNRIDKLLK